jgi:hypothetical protein|tara:strand:- start:2098 stop:2430 length:333 start_codon:yes stop_codon:yes gene_type:complete
MKVKISKTIDIGQIPTETRRMLDQAKNRLVYGLPESMNQVAFYSLSSRGEDFFQTIAKIDLFRQELSTLDESMQEIQNILVGYKQVLMPEPEHSEETEEDYEHTSQNEEG